jgi:hypothetical protein
MQIGEVPGAAGRGFIAGTVGTAAMTVSQAIEARIRHRDPSSMPAQAAAKVLGVEPRSESDEARFSNVVHWTYGSSWGVVRAALGFLPPWLATLVHVSAIQTSAMTVLPALHVAPPVGEWEGSEIASELVHHVVYAVATSLAYEFLARHAPGGGADAAGRSTCGVDGPRMMVS